MTSRILCLLMALALLSACDKKKPDAVSKLSPEQKRRAMAAKGNKKTDKKKTAKKTTITLPAKIEQPKDKLGPGTEEQIRLLTQAKKFYLNNQKEKSEPYFKALAESKPLSGPVVSAAIALGDIYSATNRSEEAIKLYQELIKQDSSIAEVYLVVGRAYGRLKHDKDAIVAFEKALRLSPHMVFIYPELAEVYMRAGEKEKSANAYLTYEKKVYAMAKQLESISTLSVKDRLNIIDVFSFLDDDRVIKALIYAATKDDNHVVRAGAVNALVELQAADAKPALKKALDREKDHEVRKVITEALKEMANLNAPTSPATPDDASNGAPKNTPKAEDKKATQKTSPPKTDAKNAKAPKK